MSYYNYSTIKSPLPSRLDKFSYNQMRTMSKPQIPLTPHVIRTSSLIHHRGSGHQIQRVTPKIQTRSSSALPSQKNKLNISSSPPSQSKILNDKFLSPSINLVNSQNNISNISNISLSKSFTCNIPFLPPKWGALPQKTLILDLDETLIHSSFKPFPFNPDIGLHINVNNKIHIVHVLKRPHVRKFLSKMAQWYELVVFTASIEHYANPLLDKLDENKVIKHRLFRQHCIGMNGLYIKDLKRIGREMKDLIILDNNPISYIANKENGLPILTWHFNKNDNELLKIIPVLEFLAKVDDVRRVIKAIVKNNQIDYNEFCRIVRYNNNNKNSLANSQSRPASQGRMRYQMNNNINNKYNNYATSRSGSSHNNSQLNINNNNISSQNKPKNININIVNQNVSNVYVNEFPNKEQGNCNNFILQRENLRKNNTNVIRHFNINYNNNINNIYSLHSYDMNSQFERNKRDFISYNRNSEKPVMINSGQNSNRYCYGNNLRYNQIDRSYDNSYLQNQLNFSRGEYEYMQENNRSQEDLLNRNRFYYIPERDNTNNSLLGYSSGFRLPYRMDEVNRQIMYLNSNERIQINNKMF